MSKKSIRGLRGERRETHARAVIRRWVESGLSKAAFCSVEGISGTTFFRWLSEFGAEPTPAATPGFVEVRVDRVSALPVFELGLGAGRSIRIPPGFDAGELERLLAALHRAAC